MTSELYIVATPIGNLADITARAVQVLALVDEIVVEDTRFSKKLLNHLQISKHLNVLNDENEQEQAEFLIKKIISGKSLALISDAGTPLINDPGFRLVKFARERSIKVTPIPGPCALVTALCASGISASRFCFEGFLPVKQNQRIKILNQLSQEQRTLVFYEAPHRIIATLQDLVKIFGGSRQLALAREMTKLYETFLFGDVSFVLQQLEQNPQQVKGEIVLVIEGFKPSKSTLTSEAIAILKILLCELSLTQASSLTAKITNLNKKVIYDYAIEHGKH